MSPQRTRELVLLVAALLGMAALPASAAAQGALPVLHGIYPNGIFFDSSGPQEVQAINAWIGDPRKHLSIGAMFSGLDHSNLVNNVPAPLERMWIAGLVPFVNISADRSAREIADGAIDANIVAWADAFKTWVTKPGGRRAFIAPLQEMNGNWAPWGQDPVHFKLAYNGIRSIFAQRGVPANTVRWVFAPNGWSPTGHDFELYYPGNANVDVVGFSAYNFGACAGWTTWDTFQTGIKPYLDRMRAMAPAKPIFIAETASVSSGGDKNAWLDDTYRQLAAYPGLRAILYYHRSQAAGLPCDPVEWRFYAPGTGVVFPGFRSAVLSATAGFGYWAPSDPSWLNVAFTDGPPGPFDDVQPAHPFAGVPNVFYYDAVQSLVEAGVTGGCSIAPLLFCPEQAVSREQMAVFLLKAKESGTAYTPPACDSPIFVDVPCTSPFAPWIHELVRRGITAGCGPAVYCPTAPVTREQMAVFLLRTLGGPTYQPPACSAATFTDVPCTSPFAPWIRDLVSREITAGCSPTAYCPTSSVTRGQMAVFLVKTFNLQ